ncbi:DUF2938 domain-containing protein [Thalassotalea fusca]
MSHDIITLTMIINALTIGIGATIIMDIWGILLKHILGIAGLNYALVGRWIGHMRFGQLKHQKIMAATPIKHESLIGWVVHYFTGIVFAIVFVAIVNENWISSPRLLPAMVFGAITVIFPYFVMQPCLGMGLAASKTPAPNIARLKSMITHLIFGSGLYLSALLLTV